MKSEDFTDDHRTDLLATSGPARLERNVLEGWNTCGSEGVLVETL